MLPAAVPNTWASAPSRPSTDASGRPPAYGGAKRSALKMVSRRDGTPCWATHTDRFT